MSQFLVTPFLKENSTLAFFELNITLGITESISFLSVEETKDYPLVQQMFYLPFVKKVTLKNNGLEIERFDILDWKDVINEVSQEIQNFLNNGGQVTIAANLQKVPVTVYAESTPNPNVMKFVANKMLVEQIAEYKSIEEAGSAPLAQALFSFSFINEVFFDTNYISINKNATIEWEEAVMEIREFIRSYLEEDKPIIDVASLEGKNAEIKQKAIEDLDETSQEIVKIIDDYIKPAVSSDGGNILFDTYNEEDKSVHVILQGACSGCPSSTITLKNGIENMLKEMLPGKVATVSAING
jgi:Fe-S cluster biogenesis protein NfuA